ncbi:hypothetical protein MRX96_027541 [Rhipicephalus microplus]
MQRPNGRVVRGRQPPLRQTTLPYGGRPFPTARVAQSQQPPYTVPLVKHHLELQLRKPRGRGAHTASNGPRPGILKKPSPKFEQQQPQKFYPQPRAPLPSWSNAPQHGTARRAGQIVQRPDLQKPPQSSGQKSLSVNCVFYQMDRPLGQLRMGTMLRCVGFMNRTGQLSVVSARAVTDDEKKLLDVLSTITAL